MNNDNSPTIKSVESLPEYVSDSSQITDVGSERLHQIGMKAKTRLDQLKDERARSKWEDEKQKDFDAYHLVPPKKPLPYAGYPNLACPFPRIGVDTFHANVMFTFAGQNGKFRVLPDFLSKSHLDSAKRSADYMTYVLNYEANFYDTLDKADMDAEEFGNGYMKAQYVKEYQWETRTTEEEEVVPEINELTGEVTRKTVKRNRTKREKVCVFDGIRTYRVSPESIFVSPFFETVKDAIEKDYFFEVQSYTTRYLEEMSKSRGKHEPSFFSASAVKKIKDTHRSAVVSRLEQNKQNYDGYQVDAVVDLMPVELAEAHFKEDINGDGFAEKVAVVFETLTGVVLRISYADCRIVRLCPRPVSGRWDGESIRKVSQPFSIEWEAIHNARVAKGQWENTPFFFYKAGGRFNPQTITLMPGKGYPVDDTNVNFPQLPQTSSSYFNEEKLLWDYLDRVLAMGDSIQGIQGGKDATATNTIHSQQRAGIRLSNPINRLAKAVNELIEHIWELNRQCAPRMKEFRVVGMGDGVPVFSKITSQDYANKVSFKLEMATMHDVQMLRDTALLVYNTFLPNPLVVNNPAVLYTLTQKTMHDVGCDIPLPKPEQAKVISPFAELDLIREGKDVEPVIGEDPDEHLKAYDEFMKSEDYENWPDDAKMRLKMLYDKTQMLKQTLQAANLNQSGMFEGMPGGAPPSAPGMTASRNPSQTFNNLRVGETGPSMKKNVENGPKGKNNGAY